MCAPSDRTGRIITAMEPTLSGSSISCASRRVFLAWRAGSSPVAGTRQTLDSTTSTIIFLVRMPLGLMETFFLFWRSVVGSVVVLMMVVMLMVGKLMVVDMLCIAVK